jgi:glycerol-3-phosphate dehydrogenase (NAD(P)+)
LITHGLADAARLGVVLGAQPVTFAGLAGIGDMIPRKIASTDRHYELGAAIAAGKRSDELGTGRQPLEGVVTAQAAVELATKHGINLPLVAAVDTLCHQAQESDPREVISRVLRSDLDLDRAFGRR